MEETFAGLDAVGVEWGKSVLTGEPLRLGTLERSGGISKTVVW